MEDKQEKAEKELFALYKKTKDPEIKKEITMQYLYIARTTATKLYYNAGKRSNAGLCKKTGVDAPGILQAVGDYRICMRGHEA